MRAPHRSSAKETLGFFEQHLVGDVDESEAEDGAGAYTRTGDVDGTRDSRCGLHRRTVPASQREDVADRDRDEAAHRAVERFAGAHRIAFGVAWIHDSSD